MGKGTSLVEYGDFSLEDVAEQEKEAEAHRGTSLIYKLKPGKSVIRALPPRKGTKLIRVAYVHYVDVPGVGRVQFNCPRIMAKQHCTVCKTENALMATGQDTDYKKAKNLTAKRRCFMNMIVRGQEENGVRVLAFGVQIENQLIEIRKDEDDGGNFAHPVSGFDLKISRKGSGQQDTEYTVTKSKVCPLSEDATQLKEWVENQPSLDRFLRVLSKEAIDKRLKGEDGGEDDEQQEVKRSRATTTIDEEIEDVIDVDTE